MTNSQTHTTWVTRIEDLNDADFSFSDDILLGFDDRLTHVGNAYTGSVDLSKIKGCWHHDYQGCAWKELKPAPGSLSGQRAYGVTGYHGLKRAIRAAQDLHANPEYYLDKAFKHDWSFYLYEGAFYINEGMHRSVVGRYFLAANQLPAVIHNVTIMPCTQKHPKGPLRHKSRTASMLAAFRQFWR